MTDLQTKENLKCKRPVVLVGSYPPPYGGCSVHVQRLNKVLSRFYDVRILDLYGNQLLTDASAIIRCGVKRPFNLLKAFYSLRYLNPLITHFHVSAMNNFVYVGKLFCYFLPKSCRRMITIDSGSFVTNFASYGYLKRKIACSLLRSLDLIITVNQNQKELLVNIGCHPDRVTVLPAFLPPLAVNTPVVSELLTEITKKGKRILITSGYGQNHYGYHHITEAIKILGDYANEVHLVLCLYNTYDDQYLDMVERELKQLVDITICRELDPDEFSFLLSKCDVYIRATDRDGDAVAIREAGYFGKKVIASSVVPRPEGTILFELGDSYGLANGIRRALGDGECGLIACGKESQVTQLINLYASVENLS